MAETQYHNTNSIPRRPRNQLISLSMHSSQKQFLRPLHSLPLSPAPLNITVHPPHHPPTAPRAHHPPTMSSPRRYRHNRPYRLPLCPLRAGAVGGAEKGARARIDAGGAARSRLRKRNGRGRVGWVLGQRLRLGWDGRWRRGKWRRKRRWDHIKVSKSTY